MIELKQLPFNNHTIASLTALNLLKQVKNCRRMFATLADNFPDVLDENERGKLHKDLRR